MKESHKCDDGVFRSWLVVVPCSCCLLHSISRVGLVAIHRYSIPIAHYIMLYLLIHVTSIEVEAPKPQVSGYPGLAHRIWTAARMAVTVMGPPALPFAKPGLRILGCQKQNYGSF
jgi:hypothetical protein